MERKENKKLIEVVCPNCGGATTMTSETFPIFTCHVGHSFSELSFAASYAEYMEHVLWQAYRIMIENMKLQKMCCDRARKSNDLDRAEACRKQSERLEVHAKELRRMIDDVIYDSAGYERQNGLP